ncbi:YgjP-like metallopeptidase domain-containing protein [Massilia sp. TS11]|uniref:YgjP-like metallopeptidase domain-containing protein n=1 Tax=Massilia sp. TS11 TaxID=2908003 RepID=UPI001EDA9F5E|nr:YgjP-like metallopeptidase domain-containing protein [Massilia sp. TS11]MCG2583479.1 DUF45 domain-containing protein [Massilia sp. TS11]
MTASKSYGQQLELFAQDFFAALEPSSAEPAAPAPVFSAPPRVQPSPPDPEPDATPAAPLRSVLLAGQQVDYLLQRSKRRTIGFTIDDDGLRVTAPRRVSLADIDQALRSKQRWILDKLGERQARQAARARHGKLEWVDGARLPFLGDHITLRLEHAPKSRCHFAREEGLLTIGVAPGLAEWQLKERVRLWFVEEARALFGQRLDHYAARLGVQYRAFALTSAGTRWGSCTAHGHIRLNWKLIHHPLSLIDYVVAHELAHLLEMNHSPRFWAAVESIYPDYEGARAALRQRAQEMPPVF